MGFTEVSSLDADVTIALGKINKETGKPYPKQAEGYFLGSRIVQNKRGESRLFFLQTPKGNLGIWGTTDLDRKLGQVQPGTMVRITSTGTKPTPNGDMYTYKVEVDKSNTIEVQAEGGNDYTPNLPPTSYKEDAEDDTYTDEADDTPTPVETSADLAARKARTEALLAGRGKRPTK